MEEEIVLSDDELGDGEKGNEAVGGEGEGKDGELCPALQRVEGYLEALDAHRAAQLGQESALAKKLARKKKQAASFSRASANRWGKGTGYGGSSAPNNGKDTATEAKQKATSTDELWRESFHNMAREIEDSDPDPDETKKLVEASQGLWAAMRTLLLNDAMLDVGTRAVVYSPLLTFTRVLSRERSLAPLLMLPLGPLCGEGEDGVGASVVEMLLVLKAQAEIFISLSSSAKKEKGKDREEHAQALSLCRLIKDAAFDVERAVNRIKKGSKEGWGKEKKDEEGGGDAYVKELGPLRFEAIALVEMVEENKATFKHNLNPNAVLQRGGGGLGMPSRWAAGAKKVVGSGAGPKNRNARVMSELSTLASSLPVNESSSIFVRADETRPDVIKALITGPEGTPYQNGAFEFDVLLPTDYPQSPPLVHFCTTGRGTVHFNPNLYPCGKVCLSLLGTWSGPKWEPDRSTLLQVLVSIQALILVENPWLNEPGMEDTSQASQCDAYRRKIRFHTLRTAVLGQILSPPSVFSDVVRMHFMKRAESVLKQCDEWEALQNEADQARSKALKDSQKKHAEQQAKAKQKAEKASAAALKAAAKGKGGGSKASPAKGGASKGGKAKASAPVPPVKQFASVGAYGFPPVSWEEGIMDDEYGEEYYDDDYDDYDGLMDHAASILSGSGVPAAGNPFLMDPMQMHSFLMPDPERAQAGDLSKVCKEVRKAIEKLQAEGGGGGGGGSSAAGKRGGASSPATKVGGKRSKQGEGIVISIDDDNAVEGGGAKRRRTGGSGEGEVASSAGKAKGGGGSAVITID